ncbi:uncharacterized protein BCR38DRAFT_417477 [Pseudomassariella vexata]|uniref:Uncharacterized protein n=1 Tax=Pseudomassariella vexata TaxID=1141098 RepID=A0A1Y2EJX2_9PEZI|nr:uncharacterized protein BCR38DRAFT_417477 [Pseudomassariella vexata]ORY71596.1 hypothetical protein BCR38DRAFT_417477 [Pseudomassariella vexata]
MVETITTFRPHIPKRACQKLPTTRRLLSTGKKAQSIDFSPDGSWTHRAASTGQGRSPEKCGRNTSGSRPRIYVCWFQHPIMPSSPRAVLFLSLVILALVALSSSTAANLPRAVQHTAVYGLGSFWSASLLCQLASGRGVLPFQGTTICAPVGVGVGTMVARAHIKLTYDDKTWLLIRMKLRKLGLEDVI